MVVGPIFFFQVFSELAERLRSNNFAARFSNFNWVFFDICRVHMNNTYFF